jgi:hypothetical protein
MIIGVDRSNKLITGYFESHTGSNLPATAPG